MVETLGNSESKPINWRNLIESPERLSEEWVTFLEAIDLRREPDGKMSVLFWEEGSDTRVRKQAFFSRSLDQAGIGVSVNKPGQPTDTRFVAIPGFKHEYVTRDDQGEIRPKAFWG